jgi:putative hydrolase of the HAD superfamily
MRHVKAVCLDLDDTLWELGPTIVRAERAVHNWFSAYYPAVVRQNTLEAMRELRAAVEHEHPGRAHDLPFLRRTTFARMLVASGVGEVEAAQAAAAAFVEFQRVRNQLTPYADVVPALERLSRRGPVVALTNGTADLGAVGLDRFFSAVFMADALGAAKPDARAFLAVCEHLSLPATAVLHAGDNPSYDVAAARAVGMAAVWVDRGLHAWPASLPVAEHRVRDLHELADLLAA